MHTPLSVNEAIPWHGQRLIIGTGTYGRLPIMSEVADGPILVKPVPRLQYVAIGIAENQQPVVFGVKVANGGNTTINKTTLNTFCQQ